MAPTWKKPVTVAEKMWVKIIHGGPAVSILLQLLTEAVVSDIHQLSPTVKGFTLQVASPKFKFLAGQWWVGS